MLMFVCPTVQSFAFMDVVILVTLFVNLLGNVYIINNFYIRITKLLEEEKKYKIKQSLYLP